MRRKLSTILFVIVFLAGLSLLLYPTVSDYWNSFHQSRAIASYVDAVDNTDEQKLEEMRQAAEAYNEKLLSKQDRYDMSDSDRAEYESLLDVISLDNETIQVLKMWQLEQRKQLIKVGINAMDSKQLIFSNGKNSFIIVPTVRLAIKQIAKKAGIHRAPGFLRILTRWWRVTPSSCMCLARH